MTTLSQSKFIETLPPLVRPRLPAPLQDFQARIPWRTLLQIHYGEPALHYEVGYVPPRHGSRALGWELGFHFEAKDHQLNRYMLNGFRRHLFEIKTTLGERIEAEMWDRGWTKIYEVYPDEPLTEDYRERVAARLAEIITCLHPFFVDLRRDVMQVYR